LEDGDRRDIIAERNRQQNTEKAAEIKTNLSQVSTSPETNVIEVKGGLAGTNAPGVNNHQPRRDMTARKIKRGRKDQTTNKKSRRHPQKDHGSPQGEENKSGNLTITRKTAQGGDLRGNTNGA